MTYKILVKRIDNMIVRDIEKATREMGKQVNDQIALGWEPAGGVALGSSGTAPYLLQAIVRRR